MLLNTHGCSVCSNLVFLQGFQCQKDIFFWLPAQSCKGIENLWNVMFTTSVKIKYGKRLNFNHYNWISIDLIDSLGIESWKDIFHEIIFSNFLEFTTTIWFHRFFQMCIDYEHSVSSKLQKNIVEIAEIPLLSILFPQKFCESNGFTKEITK